MLDSLWCLLTRLAGPLMTHFGTGMLSTVQLTATNFLTDEALAATFETSLFLATEASHLYINLAFLAFPLMASLLALMFHAVK